MAIYLENPFGPLPDVNKKNYSRNRFRTLTLTLTLTTEGFRYRYRCPTITGAKVGLSAGVAKSSYHRFLFLRVFTQNTQHSACFGLPSAKMLRVFAKMLRVSARVLRIAASFLLKCLKYSVCDTYIGIISTPLHRGIILSPVLHGIAK